LSIRCKPGNIFFMNKKNISAADGKTYVSTIAHGADVTERKKAEEKIRNSLAEKEILLNEIQHRVKNNLQVINSLLNMQAVNVTSQEAKSMLADCNSRIKTMAIIHSQLYSGDYISKVNMREFSEKLGQNLLEQYLPSGQRVTYTVNIKDIFLPVNVSTPCGLIINELLVNALKYAFTAGKTGNLTVSMSAAKDGNMYLTVKDNGRGLPPGFDISKSKSMGFKLVNILAVNQLRGSYNIETGAHGTSVKIKFRLKK